MSFVRIRDFRAVWVVSVGFGWVSGGFGWFRMVSGGGSGLRGVLLVFK